MVSDAVKFAFFKEGDEYAADAREFVYGDHAIFLSPVVGVCVGVFVFRHAGRHSPSMRGRRPAVDHVGLCWFT